jgi:hypothetical protein
MTLAELQNKFQAGILEDNQTVLPSIRDSRKTDRDSLFSIYYDAYRLRLAGFLSNEFPMLRAYLGEESFGRLVEDYIFSGPSRQRNARWYGARLPEFMQETAQWRATIEARDLARFERALSDAFDAADAPIISVDALSDICAEDCARMAFEFHPSVELLDFARGTAEVYGALANENDPPVIQQGEETVVFWREEGQSCYRLVAEDERLALREARRGEKFSGICALIACQGKDENVTPVVAGFLLRWFADGLVMRISLQD